MTLPGWAFDLPNRYYGEKTPADTMDRKDHTGIFTKFYS
jgi:hypothetical protein